MLRVIHKVKRLRIYITETDRYRGRSLSGAIIQKAKDIGLVGASLFRGLEGFGTRGVIHTSSAFRICQELPVLIEIVDTEEAIARIIPFLDESIQEGMITMEDVEMFCYRVTKSGNATKRHMIVI